MGMTAASLRTFMTAAETTLRDLFPATVRIASVEYAASGVGGSAASAFLEGGQAQDGTRYFKVAKSALVTRPANGTRLTWVDATGPVTEFTIMEIPDRPQETSWTLVCLPFHR